MGGVKGKIVWQKEENNSVGQQVGLLSLATASETTGLYMALLYEIGHSAV